MQAQADCQDYGLDRPLGEHDVVDDLDAQDWDRERNHFYQVAEVHLVREVLLSKQFKAAREVQRRHHPLLNFDSRLQSSNRCLPQDVLLVIFVVQELGVLRQFVLVLHHYPVHAEANDPTGHHRNEREQAHENKVN